MVKDRETSSVEITEKIASFTIDHIKLQPGIYVSRKDRVGVETLTTFDLRMTSPNEEPVMNTAEMHTIEHTADGVKHEMMTQLLKEFLPPIEREDIMELSHTIDEVTDAIEDVLMRMYMFNITELRSEAKEFATVIVNCCDALKDMVAELPNFRKSTTLRERVVAINGLEEQGDRLYTLAMRRLYTEEKDAVAVISWTTMFDRLEKCCDCCEHVADVVERVVMKNG